MTPEHARRLEDAKNAVLASLNRSRISPKKKAKYSEAVFKVLEALTPAALDRHLANTSGYRFYGSHTKLTQAFLEKFPAAKVKVTKVLKGVFDRDGVLHLDDDGLLFDRTAPLTEFYAHEIAHSIDGNKHEISNSRSWQEAWRAEREFFMGPGSQSPIEGFSEFGQMLFGDPHLTRNLLRQVMPNCLRAWEESGL